MRAFLTIYLLCFLVVSCVGTIKTETPALAKGSVVGGLIIEYEGIRSARAISNDKVEITFPAIPGDVNGEYTYVVQYNAVNSPNYFKSNQLQNSKDEFGNFIVTIYDLAINTNYNFSVQVADSKGNISINTKVLEATTFPNLTADFLGIASASQLIGISGAYGVRVDWIAAKKTGLIVADDTDVIKYEIKAVEEPLTPAAFDNPAFDGPQKKVILVNGDKINASINGLKPDTNYYLRVRAIHYGYDTYGLDPNYLREKNSRFVKIKTYSLSASNISIQPASFLAASTNSSSSLDLSWLPATGPFLNYRVYFTEASNPTSWASYTISSGCVANKDAFGWSCKEIPASEVTSIITDLAVYQNYQIALVACSNVSCSSNKKFNLVTASPAPPMANFSGITSIDPARYYYAVDTVYLKFSPPDFTSGVISGMYIKLMARGTQPECILNAPQATCGLTNSSFDFKTDTEVAISGINIDSEDDYCFKMIPYMQKDTGIEQAPEETLIEKCINPSANIPSPLQFVGLINATKDDNNYITLEWSPPTSGIYTQFDIWVRTDQNAFSFNEAIAGDPSYIKITLPFGHPIQSNGNMTYVLGPLSLPAGQFAEFGILVSKPDGSSREYSQNFTNSRKIIW